MVFSHLLSSPPPALPAGAAASRRGSQTVLLGRSFSTSTPPKGKSWDLVFCPLPDLNTRNTIHCERPLSSVTTDRKKGNAPRAVEQSSNFDGQMDDEDDDVDVTDDALRATIRKSKKVLELQRNLLQQIVERRNIVSSIKDSVLREEEEPSSYDSSYSSFSKDMHSNVGEIDRAHNTWTSSDQSSEETLDKEFLDDVEKPQNDSDVELSLADALGLYRESTLETSATYPQISPSIVPEISESYAMENENNDPAGSNFQIVNDQQEMLAEEGNMDSSPLAGENVMNVIIVAAECAPWLKTGGLGDVAAALPKALARRGHRVMVVVPKYGNYADQQVGDTRRYKVAGQDMEVCYFHAFIDHVDFVFIDSPVFRHIENDIYGGNRQDILKRMILFCKAAVEVPWHVPCGGVCYGDGNLVFIANDWHTSLLPVYLKAYYRDNGIMTYTRSILVIHNIAHQGRGPVEDFSCVDLPDNYLELFRHYDPVGGEHFNIFKAGLKTADRVVTVSHGYAWEIKTPEGGWGLHEIINENDWKFQGIVNGIDTNDWNPKLDIHLRSDGYTNYSVESLQTGKAQCKAALQRELGLPVRDDVPVIGFIGRLDHQKGVDIIADAMPWIASQDVQFIMLGTGREDLENLLRGFENEYRDKVRSWVGFSVKMAHRITAGADVLLMPSRFEPCGLNQLYAMMYGTVPVVHAVGGLKDTVHQFDPFKETGLGWTFDRAEANRMIDALGHCLNTYRNYKSSWEGLQKRGMTQDLSWDNAAQRYEEVLVAAKYQW